MIRLRILLLSITLCFSACQKWKVDAEKNDTDNLFAVSGFISPQDSIVQIAVYHIKKIVGREKINVDISFKEAKVTLKQGEKSYTLSYNPRTERYESKAFEVIVKAGERYELEMLANGQILRGHTVIPEAALGNQSLEILSDPQYAFAVRFGFEDPNAAGHTYSVYPELKRGLESLTIKFDIPRYVESRLGEKKTHQFLAYIPSSWGKPTKPYEAIKINVMALSPEMKAYLEDIHNSVGRISHSIGLFERFQSPANRFSNIENGTGIFAAYNTLKLKYPL